MKNPSNPSSAFQYSFRLIAGIALLVSLVPSASTGRESKSRTDPSRPSPAFRQWMTHQLPAAANHPAAMSEGLQLARERAVAMQNLMRTHPQLALEDSLSLHEWSRLPKGIRETVEEPFSAQVDLDVLIACGHTASEIDRFATLPDGQSFRIYSAGGGRLTRSKKGIPMQGVRLGDIAVVRARVFLPLTDADLQASLALYPEAVGSRCLATGQPAGPMTVAALSGGQVFYFKDQAALDAMEGKLAKLDAFPNVDAGSSMVFAALADGWSGEGLDADAVELAALQQMETSGGTRDMYVILVDFSDQPGQPVNPGLLDYYINTYVSQQISDMSYRKTSINGVVNAKTYRMPWPSTDYISDHRPMHDHAVAAAVADGVDLSEYETVCVYFKWIPGITFSGYASIDGGKMWIQHISSINIATIIHELGHNYGSYHSHSWDVSGSDPVDPAGGHTEYGDFSDIMGSGSFPRGHLHVQNKLEVQWLETNNVAFVTHSGTYRIHRGDHPDTDPVDARLRGLRLHKDVTNHYWVGYRQLYTEHDSLGRGTYVLWQQPNADGYPKSHLLDMTPGSAGGKQDGGLALGKTYSDPAAGVHITPTERGGNTPNEWINIAVNLGSFPGNSAPIASLTGPTNAMSWESHVFSVEATDPDGDTLSYFWDFGDDLIQDNSPVVSHAWTSVGSGTGTVKCTVSDMKGGIAHIEQTVTLDLPLLSWTYQNSIGTAHLLDIAADGDTVVAVGTGGFTATSTNGTDWTTGNVGGSFANVYLEGLTHDGNQFIAVGRDYVFSTTNWVGVVYTSPDGTSWTKRYDSGTDGWLKDAANGNGARVAVGYYGTILTSADGLSWTPASPGISDSLHSVGFGDGVFTATGTTTNGIAVVYTSPDGQNWTDRSAGTGLIGYQAFYDIEYCNDLFLAGGWYAGIRRSETQGTDFIASDSSYYEIPAFAYGKGIYFAAGIDKSNADADINLISSDGIDWTPLPTPPQPNRNAAVFFKDAFITAGQSGSIWTSTSIGLPESGWAMWQYHNREALGPNRGAGDDPDGDGVLNLVEYAIGSNANDASSTAAIRSSIDATDHFNITIDRSHIAGDIVYIVERSTNLVQGAGWSPVDTEVVADTPTGLTVRSISPIAAQDNEFLRFRVELETTEP